MSQPDGDPGGPARHSATRPVTTLRTWSSHIPPCHDKRGLAMFACKVAYNQTSACSIISISASGLISLQSVCWAMLCLSEKPDPRHPSQTREETEQIKPCCPSVRLHRAEPGLVCCVSEREVDDVGRILLWLQRLAVYLKSWKYRATAPVMRTKPPCLLQMWLGVNCGLTTDGC